MNFAGIVKEVNLSYVPDAKVNDYVIVHVGFAISVLDEKEALETLALFKEMDAIAEELGKLFANQVE